MPETKGAVGETQGSRKSQKSGGKEVEKERVEPSNFQETLSGRGVCCMSNGKDTHVCPKEHGNSWWIARPISKNPRGE